jgi:hypothetical protein
MNCECEGAKCAFSIAGFSRSAARSTSGEWKAPETFSLIARRAPWCSASSTASSIPSFEPEITSCPGQL